MPLKELNVSGFVCYFLSFWSKCKSIFTEIKINFYFSIIYQGKTLEIKNSVTINPGTSVEPSSFVIFHVNLILVICLDVF